MDLHGSFLNHRLVKLQSIQETLILVSSKDSSSFISMTRQLSGVCRYPAGALSSVRNSAGTPQVPRTAVRSGAGTLQVPRTAVRSGAGALDSCQEWCRNWPTES